MIYSLIITICSIAAPTDCRTYEQPASGLSANPSVAFVEAQAIVAEWMERHPGFELRAWYLEPGRGA